MEEYPKDWLDVMVNRLTSSFGHDDSIEVLATSLKRAIF